MNYTVYFYPKFKTISAFTKHYKNSSPLSISRDLQRCAKDYKYIGIAKYVVLDDDGELIAGGRL